MVPIHKESREALMSGVYGLNWYPSGPAVAGQMLRWLGFTETRVAYNRPPGNRGPMGRMRLVAARSAGLLDDLDPAELGS